MALSRSGRDRVIAWRPLVAVAFAAALAGCSGGGSSTGGGPPRATPAASATPSPAGSTAYQVTSVPPGLQISYSDGVDTEPARTPIVLSPGLSNIAFAITFVPANGNALYTFVGDQTNDGAHPVLYNEAADTTGSIGTIAASIARRAPDAAFAGQPRRRSFGALGRPPESDTRVVVRYRVTGQRDPFLALGARRLGPVEGSAAAAVLRAPAGSDARTYAAQLRARPDVMDAWPDKRVYAESTTAVVPNDTHYDDYQQWSMYQIGAPNAWGYTEGNPAIAIAVIDTGLDFSHQDFAGSKVTYAESDVDGVTTTTAASAQDTDGHGTNVAGIAAADTNNGFGFAGAGFNTSLQIYKVFANDTAANGYAAAANASDVTLAIYDAVAHGARVINLSVGSCAAHGYDPTQQAAVAYAIAHGVVVVAAAGNERSGTSGDPRCDGSVSTIDFPAAYDGVISVGATKLDDSANPGVLAGAKESVASYSNDGPGLSIVAPGGEPSADEADGSVPPDLLHWIDGLYATTAANPAAQCKVLSDCRALFAGTSQATPHVSGAAALLLAVDAQLGVADVRSLLLSNADDIGDPLEGSGRLDVYRALAALEGDPVQPAAPAPHNFVAFAYAPGGGTVPHILDVTYPAGVTVASDGTFRIADIPATAPAYKIGLWYDANGDGVIDAGDYFGASASCSAFGPCASAKKIAVARVGAGFVLP